MAGILGVRPALQPKQAKTSICKATRTATMTTSALSSHARLKGPGGTDVPKLVYGTAWKKDRTADLVYQAIRAGFRGIDTAAQPRHYQEELVGDGIRRAIKDGLISRKDIFVQTKYTPRSGQDLTNMPYDASLSIADQVHASIASSLKNLNTGSDELTYLDSVLLHSPLPKPEGTVIAWKTLSSYVSSGQIRRLGIANVPLPLLAYLVTNMDIKPSVVQNRFYAGSGYEVPLRRFCREQGILFQSFWTLSGNPALLSSGPVEQLARVMEVSNQVALYALVVGLEGITVLDGTTNEGRMVEDLEGLKAAGKWVDDRGAREWKGIMDNFKELIGDE